MCGITHGTVMVRIRHFRENDILRIRRRENDLYTPEQAERYILASSFGLTYTFCVDDEPAAVVGCNLMWEGVGQIWAVTSDLMRRHGLFYLKGSNELLSQGAVIYNIRRYHCIIHEGIQENIRWIIKLKFEYEFKMHRAAPDGSNIIGFVRWEEGNDRRTKQTSTQLQEYVAKLFAMANRRSLSF